MKLDEFRTTLNRFLIRLFKWDFPWSPLVTFFVWIGISFLLAGMILGTWSEKEVTAVNAFKLTGSYLQVLAAVVLARGLGRLEEHFNQTRWWLRMRERTGDSLSRMKNMVKHKWSSLTGQSQSVTVEAGEVELDLSTEVGATVQEGSKDLDERVEILETKTERISEEVDNVRSRQNQLESELRSDMKTTEEKVEEAVVGPNLEREIVALGWLIMGPLMSAHPSLFQAIFSSLISY
ncbi:hypothetical protein [Salinibacter ruber]|uniref:hypothetical protein n=1 Tax=Salinibacter ruber TaxID=146919 RepID=UPI00216AA364|nr:hypothetical protein [Salinibacter ruber]MCS3757363.1 vacuolar-type H+-ATPase subunit I/STV1 [Salinibacter ruber]MCS3956222.1 vacuolar-type H+-ATPase subunit I/STV1 [Salinibacter ruber]